MAEGAPCGSRFFTRPEQSTSGQCLRCAPVLAHQRAGGALSDGLRRRTNDQVSGKLFKNRSLETVLHSMLVSRPAPSFYASRTLLGHVRSGFNLIAAIVPLERAADP